MKARRRLKTGILLALVLVASYGVYSYQLTSEPQGIPYGHVVPLAAQGDGRADYLNLCFNDDFGLFISSEDPSLQLPQTFPAAVELPGWEYFISPHVVSPQSLQQLDGVIWHRNTLLIVAGTFSPFHLSHMIFNSALPLVNLLLDLPEAVKQYESRHLLTVGRYLSPPEALYTYPLDFLGFDSAWTSGCYSKLDPETIALEKQTRPPLIIVNATTLERGVLQGQTHCYSYGIVGLNRTCSHCRNPVPAAAYSELKTRMLSHLGLTGLRAVPNRILIVLRKGRRKVLNMDEVLQLVQEFDVEYRVVALEDLEFRDQVREFAEASLVIAPHGNGNVHCLWMDPGTVFLEALNLQGFGEEFFGKAAKHQGLHFEQLLCSDERCKTLEAKEGLYADLYINTKVLRGKLKKYVKEKNKGN